MSVNALPNEIIRSIFEFLPRRSLCHCSLVQKSWNIVARPEIWRDVKVAIDCFSNSELRDPLSNSEVRGSSKRLSLISALSEGILDLDHFKYTRNLELDLRNFRSNCDYETISRRLELWIERYQLLRQNLIKFVHLENLSVTFPSHIASQSWLQPGPDAISSVISDIPVFVRELMDKCQRKQLHVSSGSSSAIRYEDSGDRLRFPILQIWTLGELVTGLSIHSLGSFHLGWLPAPSLGEAMPRLKTLHYIGTTGSETRWNPVELESKLGLQHLALEKLSLHSIMRPMSVPSTVTDLSMHYAFDRNSTALQLTLFRLTHLEHLRLERTQRIDSGLDYRPIICPGAIVCTKLRSLYLLNVHCNAAIIQAVAGACPQLTSFGFEIPYSNPGTDPFRYHLRSKGTVQNKQDTNTHERHTCADYWQPFFLGLSGDQIHVVFYDHHVCRDCACGSRFSECSCDTKFWSLEELTREQARKEQTSSMVVWRQGPKLLCRRVRTVKSVTVEVEYEGINVVVIPVPNEMAGLSPALDDKRNVRLRYWVLDAHKGLGPL
jgi:hypothetical protein